MATALKLPPHRITVDEFLKWNPEDGSGALWQLRDGVPEMMAPASDAHGSIQFELAHLLNAHLSLVLQLPIEPDSVVRLASVFVVAQPPVCPPEQ